ncbi:hypothetical protein PBY51_024002 [Eleginops maclovinus]|uniref:Uncharacterized protein n=1 Tax=Eleginops maclovinus TaxID=56733 RepID=A0AAN7XYS2_ELEMC|nr:hypothetical protein PBY51_024002 [Eleginops maclovinus]
MWAADILIHTLIRGSRMIVTTGLNNESQVTYMLACSINAAHPHGSRWLFKAIASRRDKDVSQGHAECRTPIYSSTASELRGRPLWL